LQIRERSTARNKLAFSVILTSSILVGELVGGYLANSLALLSDAGHVFIDILALLLSWFALRQTEKPASHKMTFGYHRIGILAALVNSVSLVGISGVIFYEAYGRLREPQPVRSGLMLSVAVIGFIANIIVVLILRREQRENLNIRSAFLHVMGDALSSLGVIGGGAIIYFSGWFWVDPAISVVIGVVIVFNSLQVMREALSIFLEASPAHLDMEQMVQAMMGVPGVKDVHDLHVWTIAPRIHALSCHVLVDDLSVSQGANIVGRLNELLSSRYGIGHSTVQLECVGCDPNSLYCSLTPSTEDVHPHVVADH